VVYPLFRAPHVPAALPSHAAAALGFNDRHSECAELCDEGIELRTKRTERGAVDVWIRAAHLRESKASAAPGDLHVPYRADGDHNGDLVPADPTRERKQRSQRTPHRENQSLAFKHNSAERPIETRVSPAARRRLKDCPRAYGGQK
jgi:hypothetical protein